MYDESIVPHLPTNLDARTQGNSCKLLVERCKYNVRKFSFCNRIISVWNSLPKSVIESESVNSFKSNLDNLWVHEDVYFDSECNLSGMLM